MKIKNFWHRITKYHFSIDSNANAWSKTGHSIWLACEIAGSIPKYIEPSKIFRGLHMNLNDVMRWPSERAANSNDFPLSASSVFSGTFYSLSLTSNVHYIKPLSFNFNEKCLKQYIWLLRQITYTFNNTKWISKGFFYVGALSEMSNFLLSHWTPKSC